MIAGLAVQIAFGDSEQADKTGALAAIAVTGPGVVVLWVIALGLAALVVWQLAEPSGTTGGCRPGSGCCARRSTSPRRPLFGGARLLRGEDRPASGTPPPKTSVATAAVFELPGGRWLVGARRAGVLAALGLRGAPRDHRQVPARAGPAGRRAEPARLVTRIGRLGWTASRAGLRTSRRLLLVVGRCAYDPAQPTGLDAGLQRGRPRSRTARCCWSLLALGLAAFGVYCLFDARYRKA